MKNSLKYTFAALAAFSLLTACQEFQDFDKTVEATPGLGFVQTGTENLLTTNVVHKPTGSVGSFSAEFPIRCNTTQHGGATATFVYDASLVESYNAAHKTTYVALPAEYLTLENTTLTLPASKVFSIDSLKITLTGDLSLLTERNYIAPLRIETAGIGASSTQGAVYVAVTTEVNLVRPIKAIDEIVGFPAVGRAKWTADCGNFANLFDNNTSTSATTTALNNKGVLNIDMKQVQLITGLSLGCSNAPSIEYSTDGETYLQAGTPTSSEYVTVSSKMNAAFYDHFEARYLRLTFSNVSQSISEVDIYKVDSEKPAVYALTGTDNVITGKIVHKQHNSTSTSDLNATFSAYATAASTSGYSVTATENNALVAAYNTANGTSYTALPSGYLQLGNSSLSIAGDAVKSTTDATVALTGDLSKLTDTNGYLTAVKLTASGLETSESRGVVYVVVKVENNTIRPITSIDDLLGFPAMGRTSWTASCSDSANLFDSNTSTRVSFSNQNNNVVTVDMKSTQLVTGIQLNSANFSSVSFEYSTDGQSFQAAGTTTSGEHVTNGSDRYIAFLDHLSARYLRMTISFSSNSGNNKVINEFSIYKIENLDPMIYTVCGTDNVFTGSVIHTPSGSLNGLDAQFNVFSTISSASGYSVEVAVDNSLIAAYNSAKGTSYTALPAGNLLISNAPCAIAAGSRKSATQVKVSLTGTLTQLTSKDGYLVPLKLSESGTAVSASRGIVYVVITSTQEIFRKNFTASDISGTQVTDHSGWSITGGDYHSGSWPEVIDGNTDTYMRPWGSPVNWTINLGKEYDVTGLIITARTDSGGSYQKYQPNAVVIEYSDNGVDYIELGTPTSAAGNLVSAVPSSYVALYGSQKMRYIRITASYGSNMGIGEFNIYAK